MSGPLDDVVVIDLTRALAGPHCGMMLADMGARVIKVESPGHGDESRGWGPPFVGPDDQPVSTYFLSCNRNKESVTLDLKSDDGRSVLTRLVAHADVLLENFRPGVLDRLGFSVEQLHELNPRAGRAVDQRLRPRRPRGRPRRLRPDRAGRGRPDVAHRHRPRAPAAGGGADRRPARRHVRRLRRGVGAARAQPDRPGPGRAHLAARRRSSACTPSRARVHGGRRGRARGRQPPPVDLPLRPVPLRRRHASSSSCGSEGLWRRLAPSSASTPRLRASPPTASGSGNRERVIELLEGDVRRHPARRAAGAAGRARHPGRQGAHPRRGLRLGPDAVAGPASSTSSTPPLGRHRAARARRSGSTTTASAGETETDAPRRTPLPRCSVADGDAIRAWLRPATASRSRTTTTSRTGTRREAGRPSPPGPTPATLLDLVLDAGSWRRVGLPAAPRPVPTALRRELAAAAEKTRQDEAIITGEGRCAAAGSRCRRRVRLPRRLDRGGRRRAADRSRSSGPPRSGCRCWPRPSPAAPGCRRARSRSCRWSKITAAIARAQGRPGCPTSSTCATRRPAGCSPRGARSGT